MNATTSPPNQSPGRGPDEVDRLLTAFYAAEVPTPWPALAAPSVVPIRGRGGLSAGRMALAASVAALLAGGWFVSGRLPMAPEPVSLDGMKATVPSDLRPSSTLPTPPARNP
jgi:hypothetical protein